jgi:hypothetical protein
MRRICGPAGVDALASANCHAPRDLAAWRNCGDVLRDMLAEAGVESPPDAATLDAWALAASRALTADPSLAAHVARLL